jgi:ATP-binding cassette subfamily C protein
VQVAIFAGMASLISWKATAIGLVASLIGTALLSSLVHLLRHNQRERIITTSNMTARLVDGLNNMKTLKAMGVERRMTKLIARDISSIRRNANISVLLNEGINSLQELIKLLALLVAFFFLFIVAGEPLELILVVLLLFLRVMQSANGVQNKYKSLVACEPPFEHVQELIADAKSEEEPIQGHELPSLAKDLRLQNVGFAYEEERILDGVNLVIPAGHLVCLAGPSGSGKTTIMDIVCGLIRPQQGQVKIDEVPLPEINLSRWRRRIGYVPQELILFHDTLYANVTLGDDRISVAQVEEALRAAEAWDFIERLPEGLDTVVGERGIRFSGGQRQRISIARALLRHPLLLVLDEATANLDPATEKELCKTFARLRGQVTILAATHQPALTLVADAVYRVHKGHLEPVSAQTISAATRVS